MPTTRAERTRRRGAGAGAYLYVLPALALIAVTALYSIAANVVYSTWDWNGISDSHVGVGLRNYADLVHDRVFWKAIANTLVFGVATVSLQMVLGFSLAVLVRTRTRGRGVLRTLLFVPVVISPAIIATSFRVLLTPDGAFNQLLRGLGMTGFDHGWLTDPKTALATIIAINVWQYTGYSFVIYDAAISQIEPSIIEAARLDGLGALGMSTRIVAPLVKGSHMVLVVLGLISALKTFDVVFLTTGGGPGVETEFLSTYIYRQVISQFHAGYGAALSVVLVAVAMVFAVLQVRLVQRQADV